jgi:hypothetical protein
LEDWGHCLVMQQNVNENSSSSPEVFYQVYNYHKFFKWTEECERHLKLQMKKKNMVDIPISQ